MSGGSGGKVSLCLNLLICLLLSIPAFGKVEVMFHPFDPTFDKIAAQISLAHQSVDIAMYNMDANLKNPILKVIASEEFQKKVQSGELKVRLIFEGSSKNPSEDEKLKTFDSLGIDVRFIEGGKSMHHKFAVIDAATPHSVLITGSANWSLFSFENYSENILFFENEAELIQNFQEQFEFLWGISKDFNPGPVQKTNLIFRRSHSKGLISYFNTENFKVVNGVLVDDLDKPGFTLTRVVEREIDQAESQLRIATTRVKLRPLYDALIRAAKRGVKIKLLVTMNEYQTKRRRNKIKLPQCDDPFAARCSMSHNYSSFLSGEDFEGHENIDVRVKFFDINLGAHLEKQMHSKYMIVDEKKILSGSFNWSYSAEYRHIENLVEIDANEYPEAMKSFESNFERMFHLDRFKYPHLINKLSKAARSKVKVNCEFDPMSLSYSEIDRLLALPSALGSRFKEICLK